MTAIVDSRERPSRYSATAKLMHWFVAVTVIFLLVSGPTMKRLVPEGPLRDRLYDLHEAIGALVLLVMVVRLARRLLFGAPAPEATLSAFDRRASLGAQFALYPLLFVVPVLGWAGTNAYGDPVSVFGLIDFPTIFGKDTPLSDRIFRLASLRRNRRRRHRRAARGGSAVPRPRQARRRPRAHASRGVKGTRPKRSFRTACGLRRRMKYRMNCGET